MVDLLFIRLFLLVIGVSGLLAGCVSVQPQHCTYSLSKDGGIYEHCPGKSAQFLRYMGKQEDYIELAEDLGMNGYELPAR